MRKVSLTLLVLGAIALTSASMGEEPAALADAPAEVQALIDRNASCNWLATHPEANSIVQLDAQRLYFKCDTIANDVALLRKRYHRDLNPPYKSGNDADRGQEVTRQPVVARAF
jgi:hypothetical protein